MQVLLSWPVPQYEKDFEYFYQQTEVLIFGGVHGYDTANKTRHYQSLPEYKNN